MDNQEYIRGFNSGYSIQQRAPEILNTILSGMTKETQYKIGLREGGNHFEKEKRRDQITERSQSQDNENKLGR